VTSRLTIRRIFAAIVAAALALAPTSRLALAAMPSDSPPMTHDMAMPAMDHAHGAATSDDAAIEMSAEMPCCPHEAPMPADCDKCVFMAGCVVKCFSGLGTMAGYVPPVPSVVIIVRRNAAPLPSLGRPPPEHPPRFLV
jgi:hypothetical protein